MSCLSPSGLACPGHELDTDDVADSLGQIEGAVRFPLLQEADGADGHLGEFGEVALGHAEAASMGADQVAKLLGHFRHINNIETYQADQGAFALIIAL